MAGPKRGSVDNARHPSVKSYRPNDRESPPAEKKKKKKNEPRHSPRAFKQGKHTHTSAAKAYTQTQTQQWKVI